MPERQETVAPRRAAPRRRPREQISLRSAALKSEEVASRDGLALDTLGDMATRRPPLCRNRLNHVEHVMGGIAASILQE